MALIIALEQLVQFFICKYNNQPIESIILKTPDIISIMSHLCIFSDLFLNRSIIYLVLFLHTFFRVTILFIKS